MAPTVDAVLGIPEDAHVAVRHTSVRLLGELSDWICTHPQYLDRTFNFVFKGEG